MTDQTNNGKTIKVRDHFFTWSNFISFTRIFISLPIIYLHYHNNFEISWVIIVLFIYGFGSDYLDGYIARKTDRVSELGKILDPIADKITAFILFVYAVYIGLIPLWFLVVEVLRDLLILGGSIFILRTYDRVPMSVTSGKVSVNALALYWASAFFFPEAAAVHSFLMGMSLALMGYSFFDYLHRFRLIRLGHHFQ